MKRKKIMKILLIILAVVAIFVLFAYLFIKLYKPFGASPTKKDWKDYEKRSENFKNGKFSNTGSFTLMSNWDDPYKDRTTGKGKTPKDDLPYIKYEYKEASKDEVLITWFGHSSVLIQIHGLNILVDPIFEEIASPVSFIGTKRYSKVPVNIEDLPKIDVILLTHDHYDHESYKTLTSLEAKTAKYIVPLGIDKDLEKFGIDKSKIKNMAWWEETNIEGLTIACTPSRHYSGRYIFDQSDSLWSSWILKDENYTIFDSGDTGYGDHFKEISEKYGEIDFALLDSAQYDGRWHNVHMFPEEAGKASIDLNSKLTMVQHYGAFVLSNHSWDDPVDRFTRYAKENNIEYVTPILGETFNIKEYKNYQNEWWKNIK